MKMKIKKLYCFYFPTLSTKYYFFISFLIASLFRICIPGIISDYCFGKNENNKTNNPYIEAKTGKYIDILSNVIGDLLTGFVHCHLKRKYEEKKDEPLEPQQNNNKNFIRYIYYDETKKRKLFYKKIIKISIIDFICQLIFFFSCFANKQFIEENRKVRNIDYLYSFLVIDIVAKYIFSIIILKTNFYFHHRLSFFLSVVVLAVLFPIELVYKMKEYNIYFLLISFIQYVLYSYEDILNKDALIKLFIFPESILFYKGCFTFLYFIIFTILIFVFDNIFQNMDFLDIDKIIHLIITKSIFIFFNIIRSVYLVNVIDFFSSQHMSILKVLETILLSVYYIIDKYIKRDNDEYSNVNNYFYFDNENIDLIEIIAVLLLLFFSLIYNEVIVINCTKMKEKTQFFLLLEANQEKKDFLTLPINVEMD